MRFSIRTGRHTRISGGPLFWLCAGPIVLAGWLMVLSLQVAMLMLVWICRGTALAAVACWRTNPIGRAVNAIRPAPAAPIAPDARPVDLAALGRRRR